MTLTQRFNWFFLMHGVVTILTGTSFLLFPQIVLLLFTGQGGPDIIVVTRLLGAAFLGIGGVAIGTSQLTDLTARRVVAGAFTLASLAGFTVSLQSVLVGTTTAVAWGAVALYFALTLGYGSFSLQMFQSKKPTSDENSST
ncbi:MAG: hypothetical protein AAF267_19375 [Deinococcota bacterium]